MRRHRFAALALSLLMALAVTGCADDQDAATSTDASTDEDRPADGTEPVQEPNEEQTVSLVEGDAGVQVSGEPGQKPTITLPGGEPPAALHYLDLIEGSGEEAPRGAHVSMHYVGVSWSTGEQFDASWDTGRPLSAYTLDQLIRGWQEGVPGMRIGGRRLLVIPPELGYGAAGAGPGIGPNETLVFVIDLIDLP